MTHNNLGYYYYTDEDQEATTLCHDCAAKTGAEYYCDAEYDESCEICNCINEYDEEADMEEEWENKTEAERNYLRFLASADYYYESQGDR